MPSDRGLFGGDLPDGFQYRDAFITPEDEASLAAEIGRVEFFGRSYDSGGAATAPFPDFLMPLRARIAVWAGVDAEAFAMALINEYAPGAPIGWHRDAP